MVNMYSVGVKGDSTMIRFKRINISGFKNIDEVTLTLCRIISLLSINNYGKSNVLKGISFGFDFIGQNPSIRNNMMCWKSGFPLNKNSKSKTYKFEFDFLTTIDKEECEVNYGYEFKWSFNEKNKGRIIKEWLNIRPDNSQKFSAYIKRNEKNSWYKPSLTANCDRELTILNNELIINKLQAYDKLFYAQIINQINNIKIYIDRHFDSTENYNINPFAWKDNIKEKNIAKILYRIKTENPNKYEKLMNTYKELFPSIEDIIVKYVTVGPEDIKLERKLNGSEPFELADKIYYLFAKDKNISQEFPFELMSDGAKRVMTIFTYLVQADIEDYSLIAIEEPENSVHPRLLQSYLIALRSLLENARLIITSHSPYLINYIDPKNVYLGIPNNIGLVDFKRIKESSISKVMKDASDMNMLTGEYLFDLMSGTDDDIELLKNYME